MKNIFILFLVAATLNTLCSQEYEIRVQEVLPATNPRSVVVQMQPTVSAPMIPTTTWNMADLVFTLMWENSQGINLDAPSGSYNMAKVGGEGIDGTKEYQVFAANSTPYMFPENWAVGNWVDIMTVPAMGGDPTEIVAVMPKLQVPAADLVISLFDPGFSFTTYDPAINGEAVLPITLNTFTAEVYQERSGKLGWSTKTEINGSHFEIMRSTDTENWEQIGTVQSVGESQMTQNYSLIDRNVGLMRNNATYYYQIKMVDLDGSFGMSEVRSLTFNAEGIQVHTYPNPTVDKLYVNMITEKSLRDGVANVQILDNSGKLLQKDEISVNGISEIDVINVPSGLFMIRIMYADKVFTQKIVKVQ
jgi:hypothetical protein